MENQSTMSMPTTSAPGAALCPGCGQHPVNAHPQTGCVLAALVQVLRDRGEHTEEGLLAIHADCDEDHLWNELGDIVDRLGNGEFSVETGAEPEEQTVITMACADEGFTNREFTLVGHDAKGKPDYSCKHCGWLQGTPGGGAAELLTIANYSSQEDRAAFVTQAAPFVDSDKTASGLKVFEVTAAGFDGATEETDDLVFWVAAFSQDQVEVAIRDTGAKFCGEVLGWSLADAEFFLPGQTMALSSALLEKASEYRNKNRPV